MDHKRVILLWTKGVEKNVFLQRRKKKVKGSSENKRKNWSKNKLSLTEGEIKVAFSNLPTIVFFVSIVLIPTLDTRLAIIENNDKLLLHDLINVSSYSLYRIPASILFHSTNSNTLKEGKTHKVFSRNQNCAINLNNGL